MKAKHLVITCFILSAVLGISGSFIKITHVEGADSILLLSLIAGVTAIILLMNAVDKQKMS